jgi:hypothetical protein
MAKQKKTESAEPYWGLFVETYFSFCKERFGDEPSFDGSAPRDLKAIIKSLRERAERKNIEWTAGEAISRFKSFLLFAYQDKWLSSNFILFNLNRQKDKIFFSITGISRPQKVANGFDTGISDGNIYAD